VSLLHIVGWAAEKASKNCMEGQGSVLASVPMLDWKPDRGDKVANTTVIFPSFFPKIKKKYVLGTGSLRASWKKPLRKMLQHVTFSTLSLIAIFVTAEYF